MAFTAKILSWRFRHLNIVDCLLKRRPSKGGGGVTGTPGPPLATPLAQLSRLLLTSWTNMGGPSVIWEFVWKIKSFQGLFPRSFRMTWAQISRGMYFLAWPIRRCAAGQGMVFDFSRIYNFVPVFSYLLTGYRLHDWFDLLGKICLNSTGMHKSNEKNMYFLYCTCQGRILKHDGVHFVRPKLANLVCQTWQ